MRKGFVMVKIEITLRNENIEILKKWAVDDLKFRKMMNDEFKEDLDIYDAENIETIFKRFVISKINDCAIERKKNELYEEFL